MVFVKKSYYILLLFLFYSLVSFAQKEELDSLKIVLKKYQLQEKFEADTAYISTLNKLASRYKTVNIDSSLLLFRQSLALSQNLNLNKQITITYYEIGVLNYMQGKYSQSLENYQASLKIATTLDNKRYIAQNLNGIAVIDKNQGRYKEALEKYKKSIDINEQIKNQRGVSMGLNNISSLHREQGNLPEALDACLKAFKINESLNDKRGMSNNLSTIALIYKEQGKYEEALTTNQQGLKITENTNDLQAIASTIMINIGSIYQLQQKRSEAIAMYEQALAIKEKLKDKRNVSIAFYNIADVYKSMNKPTEAIAFYLKSLKLKEELGDKDGICIISMGFSLIAKDEKNYEKALEYANHALQIAQSINRKSYLKEVNKILSEIYETKGEADLALQHYKQFTIYADSINNSEVEKKTLQIQARYEFEKKEVVLKAEQAQKDAEFIAKESILKAEQAQQAEAYKVKEAILKAEQVQDDVEFKAKKAILEMEKKQQETDYTAKENILRAEQARKNAENEREASKQYWFLITASTALVLVTIIALLISWNSNKIKKAYQKLNTANKEIQHQKQEITAQAEQLQELMQAKQLLTGAIVHDLKTPIANIIQTSKEEKVLQTAGQMQSMVLSILEIEKFEDLKMVLYAKENDLQKIVQSAMQQIAFMAEKKNIDIEKLLGSIPQGDNKKYIVKCDAALIERVIVNLLSNAIKYTDNNGKIVIKINEDTQQEGFVTLEVSDNGQGIPQEYLSHIFDKFFQINPQNTASYRSVGLGLTFCKMAVEAHEGKIAAESEVGKGTTIRFSLPVVFIEQEEKEQVIFTEKAAAMQFSSEEIAYLQPFMETLQNIDIVEYSALKKILKDIDLQESEAIKVWKEKLANTIRTSNESEFKKLINNELYS